MFRLLPNVFCKKLLLSATFNIISSVFLCFRYKLKVIKFQIVKSQETNR